MGYFGDLKRAIGKEVNWANPEMTIIESDESEKNALLGDAVKIEIKKDYWPIFTSGAGLFSDGYVNNSISTASTCLKKIYGTQYTQSSALKNVSSIAFVGIVLGQLSFGVVSDYISRKTGMLISSCILIIFAVLCAGAWGVGTEGHVGGNAGGLFVALTIYRFFLGIGIGSEYPCASTACAEAAALLPPKNRNRYFNFFTVSMIDLGFVISAFVPMVMLWICGPNNLQPVWRVTLGLGAIPPMSLFLMRLKFKEGEQFRKLRFKKVRAPWWLVIKFYWFRLSCCSIIWWCYNFSSYAFGIYATPILNSIIPDGDMYKTFGWNVVLNLFYLPGSVLGAIAADYIGPRMTLCSGLWVQSIIGFVMAALYSTLKEHIGAFVTVYGIFLTLGEFGPGGQCGALSARTSATLVRGVYYSIAAAMGKIGAFCGTYAFPSFQANYSGDLGYQVPFYLASSLAIFSGLIAFFGLPAVDPQSLENEDERFLTYLADNGFDISLLGEDETLANALREDVHSEYLEVKTSKEKSSY